MDLEVPGSPEQKEEEAAHVVVEEARPNTPGEQSSTNIVIEVLGPLEPQEEVAES